MPPPPPHPPLSIPSPIFKKFSFSSSVSLGLFHNGINAAPPFEQDLCMNTELSVKWQVYTVIINIDIDRPQMTELKKHTKMSVLDPMTPDGYWQESRWCQRPTAETIPCSQWSIRPFRLPASRSQFFFRSKTLLTLTVYSRRPAVQPELIPYNASKINLLLPPPTPHPAFSPQLSADTPTGARHRVLSYQHNSRVSSRDLSL